MMTSVEAPPDCRPAARVRRLALVNFRSWRHVVIEPGAASVVLVGANGAGKTNILEAISFLAPGRGLRRATLEEVARVGDGLSGDGPPGDGSSGDGSLGEGSWAVSAEIDGQVGPALLGTGIAPRGAGGPPTVRECRIDRAPVGSAAAFAEHLAIAWLIPQMDQLFTGPAAERRRFLDRMVLAVDPTHGGRINALERALRSRNRLLEQGTADTRWLDAVEHEVAEVAVAVAAARAETVRRLVGEIAATRAASGPFPWAGIAVDGWLEAEVGGTPALALEDRYRARLADARARDRAAGRTLEGPHRSDLIVIYGPKGVPAASASTGEQKALLVGLVLAQVRLVGAMTGLLPVLLLDEIAAHFDPDRRAALHRALADLGVQAWMTGTDAAAFAAVGAETVQFRVEPGAIEPIG
ncbi:DNA replication/repair protein RecF [Blastochloris viridis]|uniref:DNA replication and repair protein RecF n=1 Tax=Blastochloris viridis TaxID=1079 RepID=A0A0H5B852_BLAVI|nr:DNA replication/repair protein RecF [Blastochloris viridis]ALK08356.1 DNA replication and repair protein RecF [Blastochloris viridis]BAR98372.1 DNA recombination and repair protein RecF [Blastochloris viridis]CUU41018.1 DNA replication and repair protein recF [Blastochloris viridis]